MTCPAAIKNESPVSSAPMISVVDAGDDEVGATVVGKGLMEYEIVGEPPAIALTLLRAVGDLSRNDLATRPVGPRRPAGGDAGGAVYRPARLRDGIRAARLPARVRRELVASARAHVHCATRRHRDQTERQRTDHAILSQLSTEPPAALFSAR